MFTPTKLFELWTLKLTTNISENNTKIYSLVLFF